MTLQEFIGRYARLSFLEIGIGSRNQLIKVPMMNLSAQMPASEYLILNLSQDILVSPEIQDRTIPVTGNLDTTLRELARFLIKV